MAKTNGKIKSFRDVWKFPLYYDDMGKVWSLVGEMAFDFDDASSKESLRMRITDCLNDEFDDFKMPAGTVLVYSEGDIFLSQVEDKNRFISIRGWGHLTGIGGLQVTARKAAEMQEEFANFIIKKLTDDNT